VPFVASMLPSGRAMANTAPVEADIGLLTPGRMMTVEWHGKPVWIVYRTREMLDSLAGLNDRLADPYSKRRQSEFAAPADIRPETRSIRPELLVVIGLCPHLGCSPISVFSKGAASGIDPGWQGGFLCACHGSTFDLAGRVFKNKLASDNLPIPPHVYLSDTRILIGENGKRA